MPWLFHNTVPAAKPKSRDRPSHCLIVTAYATDVVGMASRNLLEIERAIADLVIHSKPVHHQLHPLSDDVNADGAFTLQHRNGQEERSR